MGTSRENIIRGPGAVKLGSVQIYDKDGIDSALVPTGFKVMVSAIGEVDTKLEDAIGETGFTPSGRVTAALLAALYPYGNPTYGADIFGASDVVCEIHSLLGKKVAWTASALTKMPQLRLSAKQTLFGDCQISHVIGNGMNRRTANSLFEVSDETFAGAYDKADVHCKAVSAAWGSDSPWDAIRTKDGWMIDFEPTFDRVFDDEEGTIGMQITGITARAKCTPQGLNEAQILAALNSQGTGHGIGDSIRTGDDLVLTGPAGGGVTVTLKDAALVQGPLQWGNDKLRNGELGWEAHRSISSGIGGAIFTVAMTPDP